MDNKQLDPGTLNWDKVDGMIPAVIQDHLSGKVLMLGYMNQEALKHTLESGQVTFFSRSKQRLWTKGESSGHFLSLQSIQVDCDGDTLLVGASPEGPTCHLGTETCWAGSDEPAVSFLADLQRVIAGRKGADPESSYTAQLFHRGTKRIAQKVGEEGVEVALAATVNDNEELLNESADLLYHLLVLLQNQGLGLEDAIAVLRQRHGS
ncbi:bifunctional phosphoribosyl-AMP cyclohydrolase/phosphoribosyl-ATP diphosphatase HisIE [Spongorhabdus nitratireducens]